MNMLSKIWLLALASLFLAACSPRNEVVPPAETYSATRARFEIRDFGIVSYALIRDDLSSSRVVHCAHFNPEKEAQRNEIALYSVRTANSESAEETPVLLGGLLVPLDDGTTCIDMSTGVSPERIRTQCTFDPPVLTPYVLKPGRAYRCNGRRSFVTSFDARLENRQNNSWKIAIELDTSP